MKRILLPLVAFSIALASCSRDNDDVINNPITNPVEQGDVLVSVINDPSTSFDFHFTYDGDKLRTGGVDLSNIVYTGDKITEITINRGTTLHGIRNMKFTYNNDGTLKSTSEIQTIERYIIGTYNPTTNKPITYTLRYIRNREYSYVGNNIKITENINHSSNNPNYPINNEISAREYTLTMENGNLVRKEVRSNSTNSYLSDSYTATYRYDDKINPLNKIKGISAIAVELNLMDAYLDLIGYKNNLVYYNTYGTDHTIEYEYNSKGYPTKSTEKYIGGVNNETYTEVKYYNYK